MPCPSAPCGADPRLLRQNETTFELIDLTTKLGSVPQSILLQLYKILWVLGKPLHQSKTPEKGGPINERPSGVAIPWTQQLGEDSKDLRHPENATELCFVKAIDCQRLLRSVFKAHCLNSSVFWNCPSITCSTPMSLLNVYTCSPAGVVLVGNALLDSGNFLGTSSWSKTSWHMQGKIPIFPLVFANEITITVWGRLFSIPGYLVIWKVKRLERVNSFLAPEVSPLFPLASLVEPLPTLKVHSSALALLWARLFPHSLPVPSLTLLWATYKSCLPSSLLGLATTKSNKNLISKWFLLFFTF